MGGLRERLLRLRNSQTTSAKLKFISENALAPLDTLCKEVGSAGIRVAANRSGFHRLCGRTRVNCVTRHEPSLAVGLLAPLPHFTQC